MFIRPRTRIVDELLHPRKVYSDLHAQRADGIVTCSIPAFCKRPLTPGVLSLEVTQSFDILGAQLAIFVTPGMNGSLGDTVLSCGVVDGRPPRFAQDFYDLTFRKIHFLHGYRSAGCSDKNWKMLAQCCATPRIYASSAMKV
jgi:hypothetical protein